MHSFLACNSNYETLPWQGEHQTYHLSVGKQTHRILYLQSYLLTDGIPSKKSQISSCVNLLQKAMNS